jgi:hypothetical protein
MLDQAAVGQGIDDNQPFITARARAHGSPIQTAPPVQKVGLLSEIRRGFIEWERITGVALETKRLAGRTRSFDAASASVTRSNFVRSFDKAVAVG